MPGVSLVTWKSIVLRHAREETWLNRTVLKSNNRDYSFLSARTSSRSSSYILQIALVFEDKSGLKTSESHSCLQAFAQQLTIHLRLCTGEQYGREAQGDEVRDKGS
jgi:hypothetical protein